MDTHTSPWSDELLDSMRQIADPPADRIVEEIIAAEGISGARTAFDRLISQIDLPSQHLPASLQVYLELSNTLPQHTDLSLLKEGEKVFLDYGPYFLLFLYYKSLPTLYACANGAQVLFRTGRLMNEREALQRFSRRIAETGQFLIDVMSKEGMMNGGRGLQSIRRVRLIHAAIRQFVSHPEWDTAWGKPINQEDLAITLLTFSISMLDAMETIGRPLSYQEAKAYFHTWQIAGHFLGIRPELIPPDVASGRQLLAKILNRQAAPSEAGEVLTQSLITFAQHQFSGKLLRNAPKLMIRHLAGQELATTLGVNTSFGCLGILIPAMLKRMIGWVEDLEMLGKPIDKMMEKLSAEMVEKMVGYFDHFKQRKFEIPPQMQEAWGMKK